MLPRAQQGGAFQEETGGEAERAGGETGRAQSCQRSSQIGRTQAGLTRMQSEREMRVGTEREEQGLLIDDPRAVMEA